METLKRPYEFLIRWKDGAISGAHVGYEVTATEDGNVLSTTPLPVVPVDVGTGQGFPLAEILGQVQIDALKDRESALAAKAAAESEKSKSDKDKDEAIAALDSATSRIAEKDALIKSLQDKVFELEKAIG
jgi:hypothetical protein